VRFFLLFNSESTVVAVKLLGGDKSQDKLYKVKTTCLLSVLKG